MRDVFFPRTCLNCAKAVTKGPLDQLCSTCAGRIEIVAGPSCPTCGHPLYHPEEDICPHCPDFRAAYRCARVAVMAKGPVRPLLHELKYHHALTVMRDMEAVLAEAPEFLAWLKGARLVPVPLHPAKERHRGYNQSEEVARLFARCAGATMTPLLRRIVFTQSQTKLDRASRLKSLGGVFALAPDAVIDPSVRYVVVDDVLTTGSTLSHCAEVLHRGGATHVDACAFGHG